MSQRSATTKPAAATPSGSTLARAGVSTQDSCELSNDNSRDGSQPVATPLLVPVRSGRPEEPPPLAFGGNDFSRIAINANRKHGPYIVDANTARAEATRASSPA